jgi:hypothetical protein
VGFRNHGDNADCIGLQRRALLLQLGQSPYEDEADTGEQIAMLEALLRQAYLITGSIRASAAS